MLNDLVVKLALLPGIDSIYIVTDIPDAFKGLNVEVFTAVAPEKKENGYLPPDTIWAIDILDSNGRKPLENALVINPRYPFFTSQLLTHFIKNAQLDKLLLSAVAPTDHPCQFVTPVSLERAGVIYLFEESPRPFPDWLPEGMIQDTIVTKPFAFDWPVSSRKLPAFYRKERDGSFQSINHLSDAMGEPLWAMVDQQRAVLIVRLSHLATHWHIDESRFHLLRGANLTKLSSEDPILLVANEKSDKMSVIFQRHESEQGIRLLKTALCSPDSRTFLDAQEVYFDCFDARAEINFTMPETGAMSYFLLTHSSQGKHDFMMHYVPKEKFWEFNALYGVCVNSSTGEPILGRQQFPSLLVPDGSMVFGSTLSLMAAKKMLDDGEVKLHPLERNWNFQDDRMAIAQYWAVLDSTWP